MREQGECPFKWGKGTKLRREQGDDFTGSREQRKMKGARDKIRKEQGENQQNNKGEGRQPPNPTETYYFKDTCYR